MPIRGASVDVGVQLHKPPLEMVRDAHLAKQRLLGVRDINVAGSPMQRSESERLWVTLDAVPPWTSHRMPRSVTWLDANRDDASRLSERCEVIFAAAPGSIKHV